MKLTGENRSTRGKTCPSATLSTTNPTWTDPGSKPGLRGGRPAANPLSHGTATTRQVGTAVFTPREGWRLALLSNVYCLPGCTVHSESDVRRQCSHTGTLIFCVLA
jgi:hypothetical protein